MALRHTTEQVNGNSSEHHNKVNSCVRVMQIDTKGGFTYRFFHCCIAKRPYTSSKNVLLCSVVTVHRDMLFILFLVAYYGSKQNCLPRIQKLTNAGGTNNKCQWIDG